MVYLSEHPNERFEIICDICKEVCKEPKIIKKYVVCEKCVSKIPEDKKEKITPIRAPIQEKKGVSKQENTLF